MMILVHARAVKDGARQKEGHFLTTTTEKKYIKRLDMHLLQSLITQKKFSENTSHIRMGF